MNYCTLFSLPGYASGPYEATNDIAHLLYTGLGNSFVVEGLLPYSIYGFYIIATNGAGSTASSASAIETEQAGNRKNPTLPMKSRLRGRKVGLAMMVGEGGRETMKIIIIINELVH